MPTNSEIYIGITQSYDVKNVAVLKNKCLKKFKKLGIELEPYWIDITVGKVDNSYKG